MPLSSSELTRYSRHLLLPEIGIEGQERLKAARVLLIGAGGLGSPAALYLAAAGIGTLGLVEFDVVEESNLQRQVLFTSADAGRPKLAAAVERLRATNPHVAIEPHDASFGPDNALSLVSQYDVVIDGTDNFPTRYLVNDACVMARRPNVYGSVFRFEGQASVFATPNGPCYRCLHPEPPPDGLIPSCVDAGVLGVLPGIIGIIQATEAIKLMARIGEPLTGRLLLYDALQMRFRTIALPRDPACPVCGDSPTIRELAAYDRVCAPADEETSVDAEEYRRWRRTGRPHLLIDVREPSEHAARSIEGSVLMPLGTLREHLAVLPTDRPVVVHCKTGGRSSRAVALLREQGVDARNLTGGLAAWLRLND